MTGGNVTDQGSSAVTFRGVTFATHSNPIGKRSTPLQLLEVAQEVSLMN